MGLNIKNEETVRLAREVACRTGESMTGAITVALTERLDRLERRPAELTYEQRVARLMEISEEMSSAWSEDERAVDPTAFLYDPETGLPA